MSHIYIGIGANLGDRYASLTKSIEMLSGVVKIEKISAVYETEPEGFAGQPDFLNCAVEISTGLRPLDLLRELKKIEAVMGRKPTFRNGPRIIDLDLLLYDDEVVYLPELRVPHPRLHQRGFVLAPLNGIAPDYIHPVLHKTINQLYRELEFGKAVRKWGKIKTGS